jgi:hypothetical protein
MSIKDATCTKLQGIFDFLVDGIATGEINRISTVSELLVLVADIQDEKNSHLEKKMNGMRDDYGYV